MTLPRDFLDEVETELSRVRASVVECRARVQALEDLRLLAAQLAEQLDRPITVFDVVDSTTDRRELQRRVELVHCLRSPPDSDLH